MNNHSIYTSVYNLIDMGFPWKDTLKNWSDFLNDGGQISIAVNTSRDNTFEEVSAFVKTLNPNVEYTVFQTEIPYTDALFDGKIKNAALKRCNREFCTLLDIDEVLPLSTRALWNGSKQWLSHATGYEALFLPVIDLFYDEYHFKSLGQKWYLHRNDASLSRGRVEFAARPDGSTDIQRSDTCELLRPDGSLAFTAAFMGGQLDKFQMLDKMENNQVPYVVHLGWLDKQQRLRQSKFWAPVWNARNGSEVEKPLEMWDFDKIMYYSHKLKHWNQE